MPRLAAGIRRGRFSAERDLIENPQDLRPEAGNRARGHPHSLARPGPSPFRRHRKSEIKLMLAKDAANRPTEGPDGLA
jgi:hypothetical protein